MTTEIIGRIAGANLEKKQIVLSDKDGILKMYSYPEVLDVVAQKQKQGWYVKLTLDDAQLIKKIEYAAKPEWAGSPSTKSNFKPRNERLIVLQSMCKLGAEVFAITTTPNQMDFDTAMDLIIDRAIHDTETLMKAGGSS
jgi:hypothetical protein